MLLLAVLRTAEGCVGVGRGFKPGLMALLWVGGWFRAPVQTVDSCGPPSGLGKQGSLEAGGQS